MADQLYYIASVKHTIRDHEHITWWGPDHRGYTPVIGPNIGAYTLAEAQRLNDGFDCLAVPVEAVTALQSPEPYFRMPSALGPGRFYDQRGPVVDNTRANWTRLIEAALPGRIYKPKPEVFRGKRRAFALPEPSPHLGAAPTREVRDGYCDVCKRYVPIDVDKHYCDGAPVEASGSAIGGVVLPGAPGGDTRNKGGA